LLLCAKHLFVTARTVWHRRQSSRGERDRVGCSSQCSLTGHLNCGVDGVFEIVRVVGRGLISIAEVHAIVAGAQLAQGKPEMARNRFGLLERHGFVGAPLPMEPLLCRFAVRAGFVTLRQIFVRHCQSMGRWTNFSSGWVSEQRRKALDRKRSSLVGTRLLRSSSVLCLPC
jgi:hypothetical protein